MFRSLLVPAIIAIALLCNSCAQSPAVEQRRKAVEAELGAILGQPLDDGSYGMPKRCLSEHEFRSFRALDDRHLLFFGRRDRQWINKLWTRCPDLRYGTVLRVRSYSSFSRICEMDSFKVDEWFSWPWYRRWPWHWGSYWSTGMTCTLGKFQPVSEAQVQAIEDVLKSR